jgi:hypothetical protein
VAGVLFFSVLTITYKIAQNKALTFLSNPMEFGSVIVIPHNFKVDFPFKFAWDSVNVQLYETNLFFENPKITIDPWLGFKRELLNISTDSIYAKIAIQNDSAKNQKLEVISHPDLNLPFRVSINVKKAEVDVKDIGNWKLDSLTAIKSRRQKRFYIMANNIKGTHLAKHLFLNADYRWNEMFSDMRLSISDRASDSLVIALNAPRAHLENLSAEINANIANLPFWLKDKWPNSAPAIGKINLHSNVSINILNTKTDFNLSLKTKIGNIWQLPSFDAAITAFGNNNGILQSEISLNGNNGESIKIKGNVDRNLDGSAEAEVSGINVAIGPEILPTDVKIHKLTKKGNSCTANFTTGAGSNFTAKMADLNEPMITFSANLASKEPWAVQWTGNMVRLEEPTVLTGSFSFKDILLKANLKTKVPYAYYAAADELDVQIWLNTEGIHFPSGTIKHKGLESSFTGKVMWDKEYFTFKLNQPSGGAAEVYGTFNPKIDLSLQNLNSLELPFADTAMLKGYNGFISGNWKHDFERKYGQAFVQLSTAIKDFEVKAKSDIEMLGDYIYIKNFELQEKEKKIEGSMFAILPSETRDNLEIQEMDINIPNIDLVSLLAAFKDSTLLSGNINGSFKYNKSTGLASNMKLSKIILRDLDTSIVNFPNIELEAFKHSVKISAPVFAGLWNGNLEASIDNITLKNDFPISISYAAKNIDNVGGLKFYGIVSRDMQKISGNVLIDGDWFLPNGIGEIKNTNIRINAKSVLGKNILDSLSADFSSTQNSYKFGIFKIPFTFNGSVKNNLLSIDSVFIHGIDGDKITAKLKYDLSSANLKDLSFSTEQFTLLLLNEHWINIKNANGKTKFDSTGITIFAELPSISYNMKSKDYGIAEAFAKGHAEYHFPFQTGQSQTNPSITGMFEIGKASYKKEFGLIPDITHLDKTWKNLNKLLGTMGKEKNVNAAEMYALAGRPTILNIKIQTGMEAATVASDVAEFAFVANVSALGTTRNILLSGDINAISGGKIGNSNLTMFDLSSFRIFWQNTSIKQGQVELIASNNYPFCSSMNNSNAETCTVFLNVTGRLASLNMQPTSNCNNVDASPALIYYSMLLGCISDDETIGVNIDRNKFVGKAVGKVMSSGLNRVFGGNVVGDIDFKWQLFDENQEQDTSYVRVPFSLDKWIPNLEFVFGWSKDQSLDPRYYESYEAGLRYKFLIFDAADINNNLIDPSLSIGTNLVARRYQSVGIDNAVDETHLEKNIGLKYNYKFWDPCIFVIGNCDNAKNSSK